MKEHRFIGKPIRSLQTMLRALASAEENADTVVPDGIFGEDTRNAVISFQRRSNLPATGVVDLITWEAIVEEHDRHIIANGPPTPLYLHWQPGQMITPGEENAHMYVINGVLQALAAQYESMPMAESGGKHTESGTEAVKWIQNHADLEATGHIDRFTWKIMTGLYRATFGDGTGNRG